MDNDGVYSFFLIIVGLPLHLQRVQKNLYSFLCLAVTNLAVVLLLLT